MIGQAVSGIATVVLSLVCQASTPDAVVSGRIFFRELVSLFSPSTSMMLVNQSINQFISFYYFSGGAFVL